MPGSPITLTLTNIYNLLSAISPLLLGFFLVVTSIFNQDLKGFVYLAGVLIAVMISLLLQNQIGQQKDPCQSSYCDILESGVDKFAFNSPALNSVFIAFTIAYLVWPMVSSSQMNYILLIFLLGLFIIDGITKVMNKCTNKSGIVLGGVVGLMLGTAWYIMFHVAGYDSLLYFSDFTSGNVVCSRPSKQTFKCSVYKNGELVRSL